MPTATVRGDLKGITQKLDYLRDLGVDVLWVSPIYQSGGTDAGYDISDYYAIEPAFGTMEDFDELLAQAHQRGLKIVMDLVVNHTSDQHAWFQESRAGKQNPKRDYYIWRDGCRGEAPNRLMGYFSEPAWEYDPQTGQYYMHLFTKGQVDLNWENKELREEIYTMMNWWLRKGIDGFRMDVINCISKPPQAVASDGGPGKTCENGPKVHEYIQEMRKKTFANFDCITVGETPGVSLQDAEQYAGFDANELNMVFQFELMDIDNGPYGKWTTERLPPAGYEARGNPLAGRAIRQSVEQPVFRQSRPGAQRQPLGRSLDTPVLGEKCKNAVVPSCICSRGRPMCTRATNWA